MVARARPTATSSCSAQGIAATKPHLYAKARYDPLKDFAAIARLGIGAQLLVVPASSPTQNVGELVSRAKANPGVLNYGSPGAGVPPHLATVQFMRMAGFDAVHIPYKGGGALMTALLASEVDFAMEGALPRCPSEPAGAPIAVSLEPVLLCRRAYFCEAWVPDIFQRGKGVWRRRTRRPPSRPAQP